MRICFFTSLVLVAIMYSGCSMYHGEPTKVIMQHPETQEFVNCQVSKWETAKAFEKNAQCVEDYKKKGFIIWGER